MVVSLSANVPNRPGVAATSRSGPASGVRQVLQIKSWARALVDLRSRATSLCLTESDLPSSRPGFGAGTARSESQGWSMRPPRLSARLGLERASTVPDLGVRGSGGTAQRLLFVLVQIVHVEIAMLLEPVLVGLDRQRPHQPQAALGIGKDAHDMGAALDLLIEPFQHVGRFQMLMMLARQSVKAQRLVDIVFDPAGELGVLG